MKLEIAVYFCPNMSYILAKVVLFYLTRWQKRLVGGLQEVPEFQSSCFACVFDFYILILFYVDIFIITCGILLKVIFVIFVTHETNKDLFKD